MDWQFFLKFFTGVFTFSGNIAQSILTYVGILSYVYLFFPKFEGKMKGKLSTIRHHKLNILLCFLLASAILTSYNLYENKKPNFATPDQLLTSTYSGMQIRVADLTRENLFIRGKVFENCDLYGPAVVYFDSSNVVDISIDLSDAPIDDILISTSNVGLSGVVGFQNCVLKNVRLIHIGIIGTPDFIQALKAKTTIVPAK